MSAPLAPRDLCFVVVPCECGGRRLRGSALLRFWEKRTRPSFEDAEFMLTRSGGPRRVRNERSPLWSGPDREARCRTGSLAGESVLALGLG